MLAASEHLEQWYEQNLDQSSKNRRKKIEREVNEDRPLNMDRQGDWGRRAGDFVGKTIGRNGSSWLCVTILLFGET